MSRIRGGSKRAGYSDRYEASPRASMEVMGLPETAWAMAWRMAQFVKTLVGLPMHAAMVKGLNRYLYPCQSRVDLYGLCILTLLPPLCYPISYPSSAM